MEQTYNEILQNVKQFCNSQPAKGFEISYLESATEILEIYKTSASIIDEYGETNPNKAKEELTRLLSNLKEII